MARKRNQREECRYTVYSDQHGRKWGTTYNKQGDGTVGTAQPHGGWTAPIYPPQICLREDPDKPREFFVDYPRWRAIIREGNETWERSRQAWCERLNAAPDDHRVLLYTGQKPMPEDFVDAAEAENKWVLGLIPIKKIPEWAKPHRWFFEKAAGMPKKSFEDAKDFRDVDDEAPRFSKALTQSFDQQRMDAEAAIERSMARAAAQDVDDLDDTYDPQALGGKKFDPRKPAKQPKPKARKTLNQLTPQAVAPSTVE